MTLYKISRYFRVFVILFLIFTIIVVLYSIIEGLFQETIDPFQPNLSRWAESPKNSFGDDLRLPEIPGLAISNQTAPQFFLLGEFPIIPETVKVYQIDRPREKFNSVQQGKIVAELLGLNPEAIQYSENVDGLLIWENDLRTRRLEHNILRRTWNLNTVSYFQDPNAIQPKVTDPEEDYRGDIGNMISRIVNIGDILSESKIEFTFTKRLADRFRPIRPGESPEYVIGTLFRRLESSATKAGLFIETPEGQRITTYDSYVYSEDPHKGSIYIVVADESKEPARDIYEFSYTDFEYSNIFSYYDAVTPGLAWQKVQTGGGILTSLVASDRTRFDDYQVESVLRFTADASLTELAYYEPTEWTGYLHPIYIFRGTAEFTDGRIGEFVFYVDAITP